jgi:hypothetical protein
MLKWFDTNYHYLVPEFHVDMKFEISSHKIFEEFAEAKSLGISAKPVLLGNLHYFFATNKECEFVTLLLSDKCKFSLT